MAETPKMLSRNFATSARWRAAAALLALVLPLAACMPRGPVAPTAPIDVSPVPERLHATGLPEGWHHGAFMEIFVRGYADSDGDGIGDLRGLIAKLDYLQDLGIRGIWLMPVTDSADRDHGYATRDFRAIERDYGTLADFDALLAAAHARGIGIIMDYAVNHAAAEHPLFVAARQDPRSPWRDWFVWSDAAPQGWDIWGKNPWYPVATAPWTWRGEVRDLPPPPPGTRDLYFGTFGPHMPDFNLRHAPAWAYHLDSLRFWLNRGLDGYRLDAVPHLVENGPRDWNDQPESRALTRELATLIRRYPGRTVVCEATQKPQDWGDPAVCGGAFAFGHVHHHVQAALGQAASVQALARYWETASPHMATFVSNHDIFAGRRLWDQVAGDEAAYRLAAAGYLLAPGTPYVYYGEEVGQAGIPGLPADAPLRGPMSWNADPVRAGFTTGAPFRPAAPNAATHNVQVQVARPDSIHGFYKAMLGLRNQRPSLARGDWHAARADGLVLSFQRRWRGETTLVVINYGRDAAAWMPPAGARLRPLYPAAVSKAPASDGGPATLPPRSVQVFDLG